MQASHRLFSMSDVCKELLGGESMHIGTRRVRGGELIEYIVRMQVAEWRCVGFTQYTRYP